MNERLKAVSFLSRLFGNRRSQRDAVRPLWLRVVEVAREPRWYAQLGVADTVSGRFDAISLVLALVLLRMEGEEALRAPSALLAEVFVEDMDGQLRQSGIGDPTVGKHIGKLMKALGGRIGALREALPQGEAALVPVLERNVTLIEGSDARALAGACGELWARLQASTADDLLAGRIA